MTDARHDSTANAFHTTVVCLAGRYKHICFYWLLYSYCKYMYSTQKILGIDQHHIQEWAFHSLNTRDWMHKGCHSTGHCSRQVLTHRQWLLLSKWCNLISVNIIEVAHDIQKHVSGYVSKELKFINSYDTWYGMFKFT